MISWVTYSREVVLNELLSKHVRAHATTIGLRLYNEIIKGRNGELSGKQSRIHIRLTRLGWAKSKSCSSVKHLFQINLSVMSSQAAIL